MLAPHKWYAVCVRCGYEERAHNALEDRGYEVYSPSYSETSRAAPPRTKLLFPGYLFCRFERPPVSPIVSVSSVKNIVGYGHDPAAVDSSEIEAVKALTLSDVLRRPYGEIPVGAVVEVQSGPLAGVTGVLLASEHRLVISVTLLQRSVAAELDKDVLLRPVCDARQSTNSKGNLHAHGNRRQHGL